MKTRSPSSPARRFFPFFCANRERLAGSGAAMSPGRQHGCWRNHIRTFVLCAPLRLGESFVGVECPLSRDCPRRCPFFYPSSVDCDLAQVGASRRLKEAAPSTDEQLAQGWVEQPLSARGATVIASSQGPSRRWFDNCLRDFVQRDCTPFNLVEQPTDPTIGHCCHHYAHWLA